jgi:LuxR family maltose regulon positive regulatory protein
MAYVQSAFVCALICQARGLPEQARQKLDLVFDFIRETHSVGFLPLAQAFQAELAARQSDLSAAGRWAATIGQHGPLAAMPYFYAPQLALPKILLIQDVAASRAQAAEALSRLHAVITSIHNTRFAIEVLALQALEHHAQENEQGALAALEQAVTLARPGGFVRVFVDLGPNMADLLGRLAARGVARDYVEQLLRAFAAQRSGPQPQGAIPAAAQAAAQVAMIEPLTRREQQVLALLAQRMTAKEIAQKLVVSDQTVKRHRINVYQKLGVHSRQDAIAAAAAFGLLHTPSHSSTS